MKHIKRVLLGVFLLTLPLIGSSFAQEDGLNLPAELYVLLNEGRIDRYGIGAAGVEAVTDADTFIIDFAIAPDNNWLAYRTEDGLLLDYIPDAAEPMLVDTDAGFPAIRGQGVTVAWSPSADAVAYTTDAGLRMAVNGGAVVEFADVAVTPLQDLQWSPLGTYLAAAAADGVYWLFQREGVTLNLVAAVTESNGGAWLADPWFIFAEPAGGMRLMDLSNANTQTILQDDSRVYYTPGVNDLGEIVVFSREVTDTTTPQGAAYYSRLTISGAAVSLDEIAEIDTDLRGLRWAPGAQIMVGLRDESLLLVLPSQAQAFPLPITDAVTYGWGSPRPDTVTGLSMNADGYFRAPGPSGVMQVWRLAGNSTPPEPITTAVADIEAYSFSAGGELTYVSGGQLWRAVEGDTPRVLLDLAEGAASVTFNPNGQAVAYSTPDSDGIAGGIWLAPTNGQTEPQQVLINSGDSATYTHPRFSLTSDALIATLTVNDVPSIVLLDPAIGQVEMLGNYGDAQWREDGQIVAFDPQGVSLIDPTTRPVTPTLLVRTGSQVRDVRALNDGRVRVVVADDNPLGPAATTLVEVADTNGEPDEIGNLGFMVAPSIAPGGAFVAGLDRPGGVPLIYDVAAQRSVIIAGVNGATDWQWATFR